MHRPQSGRQCILGCMKSRRLKSRRFRLITFTATMVGAAIIILGLLLKFSGSDLRVSDLLPRAGGSVPRQRASANRTQNSSLERLSIGNPEAPVTIIEYTDFKCPECNKWHEQAGAEIRRDFVETGRARLVMRPYPTFGEDAGLALYGAYCAAAQQQFGPYYNTLFSHMWQMYYKDGSYEQAAKPTFTPELLASLARTAGLDHTAYQACLQDKTYERDYNAAMHSAAADEVQGTPTVIIGGRKIVGNQPYSLYKTLLDMEINRQ